jgi:hypothetical protein
MKKIEELPELYRKLAELRRERKHPKLHSAFDWGDTPEGGHWWNRVDDAKTIADLPDMPVQSLIDLGLVEKPERWEAAQDDFTGEHFARKGGKTLLLREAPSAKYCSPDHLSDIQAIVDKLNDAGI